MRKQLLSTLTAAVIAAALGLTPPAGLRAAAKGTIHETQPVLTTPDGFLLGSQVPGAYASLVRNKTGVTTNVHTMVAAPGAYTVWWVIFNHPASCATYLCTYDEPDLVSHAVGRVVLPGEGGNLSASLRVGGPLGEVLYEGQDPGLANPKGALVLLVIRYHGLALPGQLSQQLKTYLGGCPDGGPPCQDVQLVVFRGNECTGACADPSAL